MRTVSKHRVDQVLALRCKLLSDAHDEIERNELEDVDEVPRARRLFRVVRSVEAYLMNVMVDPLELEAIDIVAQLEEEEREILALLEKQGQSIR